MSQKTTITKESIQIHADLAKSLGIKKYDKLLTLMSSFAKPELAIPVAELLNIKIAKTSDKVTEIQIGEYEGKKTLSIGSKNQSGKFYAYMTIGQSKAKLIIEHLEAIRAFAE